MDKNNTAIGYHSSSAWGLFFDYLYDLFSGILPASFLLMTLVFLEQISSKMFLEQISDKNYISGLFFDIIGIKNVEFSSNVNILNIGIASQEGDELNFFGIFFVLVFLYVVGVFLNAFGNSVYTYIFKNWGLGKDLKFFGKNDGHQKKIVEEALVKVNKNKVEGNDQEDVLIHYALMRDHNSRVQFFLNIEHLCRTLFAVFMILTLYQIIIFTIKEWQGDYVCCFFCALLSGLILFFIFKKFLFKRISVLKPFANVSFVIAVFCIVCYLLSEKVNKESFLPIVLVFSSFTLSLFALSRAISHKKRLLLSAAMSVLDCECIPPEKSSFVQKYSEEGLSVSSKISFTERK